MTVLFLFELILPFTAAALLISAAGRHAVFHSSARSLWGVLTVALGLGLAAVGHLLWLLTFAPNTWLVWIWDAAIVGLAFGVRYWTKASAGIEEFEPLALRLDAFTRVGVVGAALISAALAAAISLTLLHQQPHGVGDALLIWNLKARHLFRDAAQWTSVFDAQIVHADYPLLLPLLIAKMWTLVGGDTSIVPGVVSIAFAVLTTGMLFASLRVTRSTTQGAIACLLLLCYPFFAYNSAFEHADVPIALFFLSTLVMIATARASSGGGHALAIVGLFAAFAAWTKNEGILFAGAVGFCLMMESAFAGGLKQSARTAGLFLTGFVPPFALLQIVQSMHLDARAAYLQQSSEQIVSRLIDPSRHVLIFDALATLIARPAVGLSLLALILHCVTAGFSPQRRLRQTARLLVAILGVLAVGEYAIYLITPYPLQWQLESSLDRLVLQALPSLLFAIFLVVRSPEEVAPATHSLQRDGAASILP